MSWFDLNVSAPGVLNIEDMRKRARRRLPRPVYDYLEGGSEDEVSARRNRRGFGDVELLPRNGVARGEFDARTSLLGCSIDFPLFLAPCGMLELFHPDAELGAARAAAAAGVGCILSTASSKSLEWVAETGSAPKWFQLYLWGGRAAGEAAIERAKAAGYRALVATIDTNVVAKRERDLRNNLVGLWGYRVGAVVRALPQLLGHLSWTLPFVASRPPPILPNLQLPGKPPMRTEQIRGAIGAPETSVTWEDLDWICQMWDGPVVVKGVLSEEDARIARDRGAAGVVVSNHGGRQLDGVPATIAMLPRIVDAVGDTTEVLLDSGVRRGSDIAKAICLGARAVLVGRAYVYGLAAAGETGVARSLEILREEFVQTARLLGCANVSELGGALVRR